MAVLFPNAAASPNFHHVRGHYLAVRRRLALAIGRIGRTHPELGEHLRTYVRTGYWCSYGAGVARPIRWET